MNLRFLKEYFSQSVAQRQRTSYLVCLHTLAPSAPMNAPRQPPLPNVAHLSVRAWPGQDYWEASWKTKVAKGSVTPTHRTASSHLVQIKRRKVLISLVTKRSTKSRRMFKAGCALTFLRQCVAVCCANARIWLEHAPHAS